MNALFSSIGRTTAYLLNTSIATNLAPSCTMIMRCNNRILSRCFSLKLSIFSANMFDIFRSITFILLSCILHSGVFWPNPVLYQLYQHIWKIVCVFWIPLTTFENKSSIFIIHNYLCYHYLSLRLCSSLFSLPSIFQDSIFDKIW